MVETNLYYLGKYSAVWVLSFVVFMYAVPVHFSMIDLALVASITTLLFTIFDNFTLLTTTKEYMQRRLERFESVDKQNPIVPEQTLKREQFQGGENSSQISTGGNKTRDDLLPNEFVYSDFNRLPPGTTQDNFEYGYSYLPPKDWYQVPPYPPVCVTSTPNRVWPVYVDRDGMELKDWNATRKITPPDTINTDYVAKELNSK